MNTYVIKAYLNRLSGVDVTVYAADRLPVTTVQPSTAYIVNTEPHTGGGEHWVAFYLPPQPSAVLEYFDSYGRPPHVPEFQQFLRRNNHLSTVHNKYCLQGLTSSVCGHYCLTYLYCRVRLGMTLNEYVQQFDFNSQYANDTLVRRLFHELFHSTP